MWGGLAPAAHPTCPDHHSRFLAPAGVDVMAFAEQWDVEARLGRALTDDEEQLVVARLDDASSLVIGYCGQDFEPDPYPDAVIGVTAGMVARSFQGQAAAELTGVEQLQTGPFSTRFTAAASSGDLYLSSSDRTRLRFLRVSTTSVPLFGARYTLES